MANIPLLTMLNERFSSVETFIKSKQVRIAAYISLKVDAIKQAQFSVWAKRFNPSQWCYFIAITLLLMSVWTDADFTLQAAVIAFAGLAREMIHLFHRIWDTTLGKSVVLITYASTANLALAYAAMKINIITGIEPSPFVFTLGFTTLVLMPLWITLSSVVIFTFALGVANIWLLIRWPFTWFGIKLDLHWEDQHAVLRTMLMRIILIPFVVTMMITHALPYAIDYLPDEPTIQISFNEDNDDVGIDDDSSINDDVNAELHALETASEEVVSDFEDTVEARALLINKLIAGFIWHFESYPNSACVKRDDQRSVVIDNYSVLLISRDAQTRSGYQYEVAKCEPHYGSDDDDIKDAEQAIKSIF